MYSKKGDKMNRKPTTTRYNNAVTVDDCFTEIQELKRLLIDADTHKCRLGLNENDVNEFGHYVGMMKDLGDGSMAKGIETIRENHRWMRKQRELGNKISICILTTFIITILSGLLGAVWLGIKQLVHK